MINQPQSTDYSKMQDKHMEKDRIKKTTTIPPIAKAKDGYTIRPTPIKKGQVTRQENPTPPTPQVRRLHAS